MAPMIVKEIKWAYPLKARKFYQVVNYQIINYLIIFNI